MERGREGRSIDRRKFLARLGPAAALPAVLAGLGEACRAEDPPQKPASPPPAPPARGQPPLKITRVRSILTAPERIRLAVVKVETSEPGLYGVGCATFTQRPRAVATAVDTYL